MQEVKAYIQEHMLDKVLDALNVIPTLPCVAIVHLREFGHGTNENSMRMAKMVKLELDLPDELVAPVVETIVEHARTGEGHPGDGKVFVSEIHEAIRIADGKRGEMAVRQ